MWPYYILVGIPLFLGLFRYKGQKIENRNRDNLYLFFGTLLLLLMLRSENVGKDLSTYSWIYTHSASKPWREILLSKEPLFNAYNKVLVSCGVSFQAYLAITAMLTVIPTAYVYGKNSEDSTLTIVLYISMSTFVMLFSGIRQSMAVALGLIAYEYVKEKKWLPFLALVIVGCLIHRSAFMLLFLYPAYHLRLKRKWLVVIIPALVLLYFFNDVVFRFLAILLAESYSANISKTGAYTMIILFALFLAFSYFVPDEEQVDEETVGLRNFLIVAVAIQMFAPLHTLAMRMNYYFIIFIPLLIPRVVKRAASSNKLLASIARYVMIVFFLVYFFRVVPAQNALNVFPYEFFWESGL